MHTWIIFGFGDFISDIIDIIHANGERVKAVIDNDNLRQADLDNLKRRIALHPYEIPIIPLQEFTPSREEKYTCGFINTRELILKDLEKTYNITFSNLIHPSAYLGSNVSIGRGVIINVHALVGPNVKINNFTLINRGVTIGHDTEIGEFCQVNPNASIAGLVTIGDRTTIGIGATIIDKIRIGEHSFVGGGAAVVKDVPDNVVVVGVPAKILKKNEIGNPDT